MPDAIQKDTLSDVADTSKFSINMLICGINTSTSATYLITKPDFLLGKSGNCDGVLDFSEEVSREHARISWTDGHYTVTDLNSLNGTFLNGSRLASGEPYLLHEGDRIGLSTFLFSVKMLRR